MEDQKRDFFISYTAKDRQWAEWIAWQLEAAGFTSIIQAWDFGAGSDFIEEMDRASQKARRTIAVLSPDYFKSKFTRTEWHVPFAKDATGEDRKLIPVRVRECDVEGLLRVRVYIDLVSSSSARFGLMRRLSVLIIRAWRETSTISPACSKIWVISRRLDSSSNAPWRSSANSSEMTIQASELSDRIWIC
ncbi:MAG TPA: toll/interleukin-1 receptor domain-containing protein [Blastocatellia bacterium]|nr:toll/interleukin-1 receptor domain-containing protein [Blastocatellia bacterium]